MIKAFQILFWREEGFIATNLDGISDFYEYDLQHSPLLTKLKNKKPGDQTGLL